MTRDKIGPVSASVFLWWTAVELQYGRIVESKRPKTRTPSSQYQQAIEVRFFLVALRNLVRGVEQAMLLLKQLPPPEEDRLSRDPYFERLGIGPNARRRQAMSALLSKTISEFHEVVPSQKQLRDISEHFDAYLAQQGKHSVNHPDIRFVKHGQNPNGSGGLLISAGPFELAPDIALEVARRLQEICLSVLVDQL